MKTTREAGKALKGTRAMPRRGESDTLRLILAVVAVVIAVAILLYLFGGAWRNLATANTPATLIEYNDYQLIVNIKLGGTGYTTIYNITPLTSTGAASCSNATYYLDGRPYTPPTNGPLAVLRPGQTLTVVYTDCNPPINEVTSILLDTAGGSYVMSIGSGTSTGSGQPTGQQYYVRLVGPPSPQYVNSGSTITLDYTLTWQLPEPATKEVWTIEPCYGLTGTVLTVTVRVYYGDNQYETASWSAKVYVKWRGKVLTSDAVWRAWFTGSTPPLLCSSLTETTHATGESGSITIKVTVFGTVVL